jgi:hypothetical protein
LKKLVGVSISLSDDSNGGPRLNLVFDLLQKEEFAAQNNVDCLDSIVKQDDAKRGTIYSLIGKILWQEQEEGVPGRMRRGVKMKWPKMWLEFVFVGSSVI